MRSPATRDMEGVTSFLFVPAGNQKLLRSAAKQLAGAVILDLEDAVPPGEKAAARAGLAADVALLRQGSARICVRVNRPWTSMVPDLTAAVAAAVDMVVLPKIETAAEVMVACEILDELSWGRAPAVISLIESAKGLVAMPGIANVRPDRHAALMLGAEDLALDLGTKSDRDAMTPPAQALVVGARAGGLLAIGSPGSIAEIGDMESYRSQVEAARLMGFSAVAAIHPRQIEVIRDIFQPDRDELAWARLIVELAARSGGRPFLFDGRMVDAPVVARAQALLGAGDPPERR